MKNVFDKKKGSTVDLMLVQISSCSTTPCAIRSGTSVTVTAEFLGGKYIICF